MIEAKFTKFPENTYNIPKVRSTGNCAPESLCMLMAEEQDMNAEQLRQNIRPLLEEDEDGRYSKQFGAKRKVTFNGVTYVEDYPAHVVRYVPHQCDVTSNPVRANKGIHRVSMTHDGTRKYYFISYETRDDIYNLSRIPMLDYD